jgi:hypothetical protein
VVAKVEALDAALKHAGFKSRRGFASSLHTAGAPGRATVLNLWLGNVIGVDKAEVIAAALEKPVGELFQLSNGRQIK